MIKRRQFAILLYILCAFDEPQYKTTVRIKGAINDKRLERYLDALTNSGHLKHSKKLYNGKYVITAKGKIFRKHPNAGFCTQKLNAFFLF